MTTPDNIPQWIFKAAQALLDQSEHIAETTAGDEEAVLAGARIIAEAYAKRCQYPDCLENEDGTCARWITGECSEEARKKMRDLDAKHAPRGGYAWEKWQDTSFSISSAETKP